MSEEAALEEEKKLRAVMVVKGQLTVGQAIEMMQKVEMEQEVAKMEVAETGLV
jgi:hypothetical protein